MQNEPDAPAATDDEARAPHEKPPPETAMVAKLDGEGRYFGMEEMPIDEVLPGAVVVPKNCDLPADGSHRWHREHGAFLKLAGGHEEPVNFQAETVAALAGLGFALRAAGMPLPPLTLKWLRWFETTLDYRGLATKGADGKPAVELVKPSEFKE